MENDVGKQIYGSCDVLLEDGGDVYKRQSTGTTERQEWLRRIDEARMMRITRMFYEIMNVF